MYHQVSNPLFIVISVYSLDIRPNFVAVAQGAATAAKRTTPSISAQLFKPQTLDASFVNFLTSPRIANC